MSKIYLSEYANPILKDYLKHSGHKIVLVRETSLVYEAVAAHPDIYLCKLGTKRTDPVYFGNAWELGFRYPANVRYNAVFLGEYFIHNLTHTAGDLLELAHEMGKTLVHVEQGYTKCNIAVVNEKAVITSDHGIASALSGLAVDFLEISPGHIKLSGFPHGFIGGASGRVGGEMIFHGDLSAHPDYAQISAFVRRHGCKSIYFNEFELEDIGSIIESESETANEEARDHPYFYSPYRLSE